MGWVSGSNGGDVHMQETRALSCKIVRKCPTIELKPASLDHAGATAYDPRAQAVWASDGITITNHSLGLCKTICSAPANRLLGSASVVSGLTVNDTRSHLYQLETIPGRFAIAVYDISKPSTSNCFNSQNLVTSCNSSTLTQKGLATGIAYDEGRDLLYIATSEPNGSEWKHYILVADRSQPCRVLCQYNVAEFDKKRIATGLEFVTGQSSMLYLSNGVEHLEIAVGDPKKCQFTPGKSCTATGSFRGLAMVPGWDLQRFGKSVLPASCASCNRMELRLFGGDPALGNPAFGISVADAPAGGTAGFFIRPGACTSPVPILGGNFYAATPLAPILIPLTGPGCAAQASLPLPIPAIPALTGLDVCVQGVIACPKNELGMTGAIQFAITGS